MFLMRRGNILFGKKIRSDEILRPLISDLNRNMAVDNDCTEVIESVYLVGNKMF